MSGAVFILLTGLLASHRGVGSAQAFTRLCGYKPGRNGCSFDKNSGTCHDTPCKGGVCVNQGCV